MMSIAMTIADEVAAALADGRPVVALESTLIAHGLPWPVNVETAHTAEAVVRAAGAVPATIAVWEGAPTIGLTEEQTESLGKNRGASKASRRDLAAAIATKCTAATTVAASLFLAHRAGIRVLGTGGIGGVHRGAAHSFDISADLLELARTPGLVVCSGAKSILDLPKTMEMLETLGVPVLGYRTNEFPAFYVRTSGLPAPLRIDSAADAARVARTHWDLAGAGVVLAQPAPDEVALTPAEFAASLAAAEAAGPTAVGSAVTPTLLARLAEATAGRSLHANQGLILANARLAAEVASELTQR